MLQLGPVALLCQKSCYQKKGCHDRQKPEKSKVLGGKGSGPRASARAAPAAAVCALNDPALQQKTVETLHPTLCHTPTPHHPHM